MSALADYYAAMAAEKQAGIPLQAAQARLTNLNASNVNDNDAARRAVETAQAGLFSANASVVRPNAVSEIANRDSLTKQNVANTATIGPKSRSDLATAAIGRAVAAQGFTPLGDLGAFGLTGAAFPQGSKGLEADRLPTLGTASTGQPMGLSLPSAPSMPPVNATGNVGDDQTLPFGFKKPTIDNSLVPAGYAKGGIVPAFTRSQKQQAQGFAKGTATVKPKSGGAKPKIAKSDTVPAMLTPGEAVLNKGAVDHYGPGVIGHMNRMGMLRHAAHKEHHGHMKKAGIVGADGRDKPTKAKPAKGKGMVPQGFAKGVERVRPALASYLGFDQGPPHNA